MAQNLNLSFVFFVLLVANSEPSHHLSCWFGVNALGACRCRNYWANGIAAAILPLQRLFGPSFPAFASPGNRNFPATVAGALIPGMGWKRVPIRWTLVTVFAIWQSVTAIM